MSNYLLTPLHLEARKQDMQRMENPHAERQAVLLERILKNAVSVLFPPIRIV